MDNPVLSQTVNLPTADSLFVCPDCGRPLQQTHASLDCGSCDRRWPIVNGIPQFVEDFQYWGEHPQDTMQKVNEIAASDSWKKALYADLSHPSFARKAEIIQNLDRANWHWLLPLGPESRVLELGAGTGTNSHALAKAFREVVALEPVLERTEFMRLRFEQEGINNIKVVRSSVWTLPFAPESFDLAFFQGVLEWVPEGRSEDPRMLQLKALKKVRELIRPGGYLSIAIENRLNLAYFCGAPDEHCLLPYIMLLPRPLAHWYAKRKGFPNGYRNYIYSYRGLRDLLHDAGFSKLQFYLALPHYNNPQFYVPLQEDIFAYYARNFDDHMPFSRVERLAYWMLKSTRTLKYLQDSFVVFAKK